MDGTGSFISALIATYALSRLLLRVPVPLTGLVRLIAVHVVSLGILALLVGWLKSYFVSFAIDATYVLIAPQLLWLAVDFARGRVPARR